MTTHHRRYEIQCALSSSGELSDTEIVALRMHAEHCQDCRARINGAIALDATLLIAGLGGNQRRSNTPSGMFARFKTRAVQEGISLRTPWSISSTSPALRTSIALLTVLIFVFAAWRTRHPFLATPVAPVTGSEAKALVSQTASLASMSPAAHLREVPSIRRTTHMTDNRTTVGPLASNGPWPPPHGLILANFIPRNRPYGVKQQSAQYLELTHYEPSIAAILTSLDLKPGSGDENLAGECARAKPPGWIVNGPSRPQHPVFCFDPKLAFIADSAIPELLKRYRNRADERELPVFQFTQTR